MKLHELSSPQGSRPAKRRVGRGTAARRGKTAGRGTKGQNARTGGGVRPYFEGGQLPLIRRLPFIGGFTPLNRIEYTIVNIDSLDRFEPGSEVTPESLVQVGLVKSSSARIKILGRGELDRPLTVKAHKFSAGAREKIAAAGGSAIDLTE